MYNPQGDVKKFMDACSQETHDSPTMPSRDVLLLRAKLLFEEVLEFIEAAGCTVGETEDGELVVFIDREINPDMVQLYDAIVDINYVSYGAACALGLDVEAGHNEVQRSNMTKVGLDGKVIKNEFGKIQKPATFSPADLHKVLEEQINKNEEHS